MKWKSRMSAAAAAGVLTLASQAQAAVVTYVYRGAFLSGVDETGVFGVAGRDLQGLAVTAVFRRDDDAPSASIELSAPESFIYGSGPEGPVTGSLRIDGVTRQIFPGYGEQVQAESLDGCGPGCDVESFSHLVSSRVFEFDPTGTVLHQDNAELEVSAFGFGTNLLPSYDYHTLASFRPGEDLDLDLVGRFTIDEFLFDTTLPGYTFQGRAQGTFSISSLRVFEGAAVPEPATWALMILGFGGAGAALRRRRLAPA